MDVKAGELRTLAISTVKRALKEVPEESRNVVLKMIKQLVDTVDLQKDVLSGVQQDFSELYLILVLILSALGGEFFLSNETLIEVESIALLREYRIEKTCVSEGTLVKLKSFQDN